MNRSSTLLNVIIVSEYLSCFGQKSQNDKLYACQVDAEHKGNRWCLWPDKSMICSFLGSALASKESERQSLLSVRLPNWLPPEQLQLATKPRMTSENCPR